LDQLSDSDDEDDEEAHTGFEDWEPEEPDWFLDAPDEDDDNAVAEWDEDTVENLGEVSDEALVTADSSKPTHRVELYDSRCTNHISPFREQFENYVDITPKRFRAANQETFNAIGRGELVINIPNGSESSLLRLENALYAPGLDTHWYPWVNLTKLVSLQHLVVASALSSILMEIRLAPSRKPQNVSTKLFMRGRSLQ